MKRVLEDGSIKKIKPKHNTEIKYNAEIEMVGDHIMDPLEQLSSCIKKHVENIKLNRYVSTAETDLLYHLREVEILSKRLQHMAMIGGDSIKLKQEDGNF